jgi:hypothetical protein
MAIITLVAQLLPLLLVLQLLLSQPFFFPVAVTTTTDAAAAVVLKSNETFWCGQTITDAIEICLQSCPTTISTDCPNGTICWYTGLTACNEYSTYSPTMTMLPTNAPSLLDSYMPSDYPSEAFTPTVAATSGDDGQGGQSLISYIESKKELINKFILVSFYKHPTTTTSAGLPYPSTKYTYNDFITALQQMSIIGFGANFTFNIYNGQYYGIVNIAAFLANCMVESIQYDICDESNWEESSLGGYPASNACGQNYRSYQDERCTTATTTTTATATTNEEVEDDIYSCPVKSDMEITATDTTTTSSLDESLLSPPPLSCQPYSTTKIYPGYWEDGELITNIPLTNKLGRNNTEGCCFWGRGALLTRGVCNIGKINYYLGKGGTQQEPPKQRQTLYPTIDFCTYPEAICASPYSDNLRWEVAMLEWAERIQQYHAQRTTTTNENGGSLSWQYEEKLMEFVNNGMLEYQTDDTFIDSVSRIVTRGCHEAGCSSSSSGSNTDDDRYMEQRRSNFYLILNTIFDKESFMLAHQSGDVTTYPPTNELTRRKERSSRPTSTTQVMVLEDNAATTSFLATTNAFCYSLMMMMMIQTIMLLYGA